MKKEKSRVVSIRLKESRYEDIKKMADTFDTTVSKLTALLLESGFIIAEAMDKDLDTDKKEESKNG